MNSEKSNLEKVLDFLAAPGYQSTSKGPWLSRLGLFLYGLILFLIGFSLGRL